MSEPRSRRREPNRPGGGSGGSSDSSENASGNIGSNTNIREAVATPTQFAALGVSSRVDAGLASAGFAAPFAIQTEAIPVALTGVDVCGRARTGSGKTLAFGVPMIDRATRDPQKAKPNKPRGVVLVPTRELAVQVTDVLAPIAQHCDVRVVAIYGGAARDKQVEQLVRGIEIIIATPLRLIDLMKNGEADLSEVEMIVLDEADRMADEGFMPQVEWVLRHVTKEHQTMLFSATLDGQVA
ncbi:MAG: DEAD/DEAH box helicase, partial [Ilumatobacteraceae bacterium]